MTYPANMSSITPVTTGQLITSAYTNTVGGAINQTQSALGLNPTRHICWVRLTLTEGVWVPTSDVSGATSVFLTGDRIALFDGVDTWNIFTLISDLELSLSSLDADTNYDVFCYDDGGTPTLEALAWTDDTTRDTDVVLLQGVLVKDGDATRRYLGSFRTTSDTPTTKTEDSASHRYLFNVANQVTRHFLTQNVSGVTSTSSTWAALSGTTASFINGWPAGSVSYGAISNFGSHSAAGTLSSFGAGVGADPANTAFTSVHAPDDDKDFCFTPPVALAYPSLGLNDISAYAKTAASTLTVNNPGVSGWLQM